MPDAKPDASPPAKKKKKQSAASMQRELRDLARPSGDTPEKPPADFKKIAFRVGLCRDRADSLRINAL